MLNNMFLTHLRKPDQTFCQVRLLQTLQDHINRRGIVELRKLLGDFNMVNAYRPKRFSLRDKRDITIVVLKTQGGAVVQADQALFCGGSYTENIGHAVNKALSKVVGFTGLDENHVKELQQAELDRPDWFNWNLQFSDQMEFIVGVRRTNRWKPFPDSKQYSYVDGRMIRTS